MSILKRKRLIVLILLIAVNLTIPGILGAAYSASGSLTSTNLLTGQTVSTIDSFVYNLSAKPANTTATVQFSQDNSTWYNSSGALDGTDTLTTGANNTISLSTLAWTGANFYYKVAFATSDGVDTPVLDDIAVNFSSWQPRPSGVQPSGGSFLMF